MKKPSKNEIREWKEEHVTKWFLEEIARKLNSIDTVRNINEEQNNITETLVGRRMAIEILEGALRELIDRAELAELQEAIAEDEEGNVIQMLNEY